MFIVLPLTGIAGAYYFLLTFLAVLLRTCLFLMFGHLYLTQQRGPASADTDIANTARPEKRSIQAIFQGVWNRLPNRMSTIFVWILPIFTLVFILHWNGVFDVLNMALSQAAVLNLMPVESLSVVILSFAAEFTSGFAAAGALLNAGVLTVKQTVLALLTGNILAFPIRRFAISCPGTWAFFLLKSDCRCCCPDRRSGSSALSWWASFITWRHYEHHTRDRYRSGLAGSDIPASANH